MQTIQELANRFYPEQDHSSITYNKRLCEQVRELVEFYVTEALNSVYEKGLSDITTWDGNPYGDEGSEYLDFDKLIEAYPLENIK